jgi:hypothetical protein
MTYAPGACCYIKACKSRANLKIQRIGGKWQWICLLCWANLMRQRDEEVHVTIQDTQVESETK